MLCKYPTVFPNSKSGLPSPCGQCVHCGINRARVWSNRMICEAMSHSENSFLTLTYDDDHLPSDLSLNPDHHREFMYRFRDHYSRSYGKRVRFYMAGEYGEKTHRPHYHYALFGYPPCPYGGGRRLGSKFVPCPCSLCRFLSDRWGQGNIFLGTLTPDSAQYTCKYITKRMSKPDDPRLLGRYPEFSLQSNKPGIGAQVIPEISSILTTYGVSLDDFPNVLLHGQKSLPLGRYMKAKLLDEIGVCLVPGVQASDYKSQLSDLLSDPSPSQTDASLMFKRHYQRSYNGTDRALDHCIQFLHSQRVLNVESQLRFFRKEAVL